eukprot:6484490-Amphidinium_carterae.3
MSPQVLSEVLAFPGPITEEQSVFHELVQICFGSKTNMDDELQTAMEQYMSTSHVQSKTVAAASLGLGQRKFEGTRRQLAMAIMMADRLLKSCLEHLLETMSDVAEVLVVFDGVHCHDEMSIKASFRAGTEGWQTNSSGVGRKVQATAVCKVLQTQSHYAILVHLAGHFILLHGSLGTHLQTLQTTSGEVIFKALTDQKNLTGLASKCNLCMRLVCTDSHKGTYCCKHLEKTLELAGPTPSYMLHLALALRGSSGSYLTFRRALAATILDRLVVLHGKPTEAANNFREACMILFTKDRPHANSRLAILRCLANGDWRQRECVQHYVGARHAVLDKTKIAQSMATHLVWGLLPSIPALCKTKSWGDVDHALCDLGIIASCHGLLDPAFTLYCKLLHGHIETGQGEETEEAESTNKCHKFKLSRYHEGPNPLSAPHQKTNGL